MTVRHDPVEAQVEVGLVLAITADQVVVVPDQPIGREVVQHAGVDAERSLMKYLGSRWMV
jgi:hypothetical protein